ncbi:MAG TPA: response regulator [Labilithrix sp.]|jgi:two-component system response regulator|nr:response regulator [Labilithrix sp.]
MSLVPYEIVLVEDSDEDAELTLRALKRQNLANNVHRAIDGSAALDYFFEPDDPTGPKALPRVVLLDLKLPKVSGLEVLERLKSNERTRNVPVVVLTSSKEDRDLAEAYRLGANSYIVKPVEFEKFAQAIETLGMYWMLVNQPQRI